MDGKMKTCVAFYVVFLLTLCECKNRVTGHENGDDFINPKLIQQLFENLESKMVIEKLISRVDRLESRERELQRENDALSKKVEELEILALKQEKEIEYLQAQMRTQHANVDSLLKAITPVASGKEYDNDVRNDTASPKTKRQVTGSNYEGNHVAFFVGISAHYLQHQGKAQPVAFDKVITNVGNAYNAHVGDFRAPVAGTYAFSVTLMAWQSHTTHYYFAKNGIAVTWLYVRGQESPEAVSSQTAVLELNQGDDVSIRNHDADESLFGDMYSTFSGFLLREKFPNSVIG